MKPGMHLERLADDFRRVRSQTEALAGPLSSEDQCVQSMPDASPTKWHRAHTTWFFETFVLAPSGIDIGSPSEYAVLFNSYYNAVGEQYHRPSRGMLTRPSNKDVAGYRARVDEEVLSLIDSGVSNEMAKRIELGIHHEQQHQELLLTDVKHLLSHNPLDPVYALDEHSSAPRPWATELTWVPNEGGVVPIGHADSSFHFDNEGPKHDVLLRPFELTKRLVNNAEYARFVDDGGYERPELWLSDGWTAVRDRGWKAPLYWQKQDGEWTAFTLHGRRRLSPTAPVSHVSYYEADAYARWAGARLPTEFEWESGSAEPEPYPLCGRHAYLHPKLPRIFYACWQWTSSGYSAYPSYRPVDGAIGEYNGKFMCGQYVLRGGSCVTPAGHVRRTYRNFFPPDARWQFSGIRLARDSEGTT